MTGILEIKCPYKTARHLAALKGVPPEYLPQITHNLWVSGADWCDFVSYDPRLPEKLRLIVHRVHRDDVDIPAYAKKAEAFLAEVEAEYRSLLTLSNLTGTLAEAANA